MFLEINIGLIVGTAIIASLLNLYVKEESHGHVLSKAITYLSLCAILSGIVLYMSIVVLLQSYLQIFFNAASIDFIDAFLTALSLLFFIVATEQLFTLASSRLSQTQKERKQRE